MKKNIVIVVIAAAVIFTGLFLLWNSQGITTTPEGTPREACIDLCMVKLAQGVDLNKGPCLSNKGAYVCDVAHSPRQDVDSNVSNQCSEYGKSAQHFVEVTPECIFIREA